MDPNDRMGGVPHCLKGKLCGHACIAPTIQTDNQSGAVQRMLTYRPGGDLLQDNHVGGTLFGYIYNAAKRLVEVTQNGTAEGEYAYDFQGQRVLRWILGSAYTAYIHDEQGHLLAEHNGHTGAVSVEYTWIDDMPVEQESAGATWFIHTGQIGEVQMVTNGNGTAALWSAYVDPYGTATNIGTPSITMNMRLPGQYYQDETNSLSQNRYRDYDPSLGRYVEADPVGVKAGQNVYAYVDGDPLNVWDPKGLRPITPADWGMIGGADAGIEIAGLGPEDPFADLAAALADIA